MPLYSTLQPIASGQSHPPLCLHPTIACGQTCVYEGFWGHEGEFLPWRKFALSFALSHFPLDHSLSAQTRDSVKKSASVHIGIWAQRNV